MSRARTPQVGSSGSIQEFMQKVQASINDAIEQVRIDNNVDHDDEKIQKLRDFGSAIKNYIAGEGFTNYVAGRLQYSDEVPLEKGVSIYNIVCEKFHGVDSDLRKQFEEKFKAEVQKDRKKPSIVAANLNFAQKRLTNVLDLLEKDPSLVEEIELKSEKLKVVSSDPKNSTGISLAAPSNISIGSQLKQIFEAVSDSEVKAFLKSDESEILANSPLHKKIYGDGKKDGGDPKYQGLVFLKQFINDPKNKEIMNCSSADLVKISETTDIKGKLDVLYTVNLLPITKNAIKKKIFRMFGGSSDVVNAVVHFLTMNKEIMRPLIKEDDPSVFHKITR